MDPTALASPAETAALIGVATLAFVSSPHCAGMCGPMVLAATSGRGKQAIPVFLAGKTFSYVALGAGAGMLGSLLDKLRVVGFALAAVMLLIAVLQLAGVLEALHLPKMESKLFGQFKRLDRKSRAFPFWLGAATGLLPCGVTISAMTIAGLSGTPVFGALTMFIFGLATSPVLGVAALGGRALAERARKHRGVLAVVVGAVGLYTMVHRIPKPEQEVAGLLCRIC